MAVVSSSLMTAAFNCLASTYAGRPDIEMSHLDAQLHDLLLVSEIQSACSSNQFRDVYSLGSSAFNPFEVFGSFIAALITQTRQQYRYLWWPVEFACSLSS